jgi:putative colanic acid biosynthesis acetyltransferase WcaF
MNSTAIPPTPEQAGGAGPGASREKPSARLRLDLYDNSDFDRGASRLKEALWVLCKCVFFLNPLPWPSAVRVWLLRLFGARIGSRVVIRSGVNITFPWRFTTGDHVWIGDEVFILSLATVTLGSHVCISQRAFLCTGSHAWRHETFDLRTRAIVVEDSVWIAAQAFVGPGTRIGDNSVVSAGAVVMKSMPSHSLAVGNPAVVRLKD